MAKYRNRSRSPRIVNIKLKGADGKPKFGQVAIAPGKVSDDIELVPSKAVAAMLKSGMLSDVAKESKAEASAEDDNDGGATKGGAATK